VCMAALDMEEIKDDPNTEPKTKRKTKTNKDVDSVEKDDGDKRVSGSLTWPDGVEYEGESIANRPDGMGTMTWPNGDVHVGQWRNGVRAGYGTLVSKDGAKKTGIWIKDKLGK
jgi:hypothetical protein